MEKLSYIEYDSSSWINFRLVCCLYSAANSEFKVRSGSSSYGPVVYHMRVHYTGVLHTLSDHNAPFPVDLRASEFYITLSGPMSKNDFVHIAFSDNSVKGSSTSSFSKSSEYSWFLGGASSAANGVMYVSS